MKREPVTVKIDDLQEPSKQFILFDVTQGTKGVNLSAGRWFLKDSLEQHKVYAILPLLAGYECELHAFANGAWQFEDRQGRMLPELRCEQMKPDRWIVALELNNQVGRFDKVAWAKIEETLSKKLYDILDTVEASRPFRSARREEAIADAERRKLTPREQVSISRRRTNFLLTVSVD